MTFTGSRKFPQALRGGGWKVGASQSLRLSFFFFPSAKAAKEMIYRTHYIQPQLRRKLVHSITGPGQRTKRGSFDTSKAGLSKVVEAIRMARDAPDPVRSSRSQACSP